MKHLPALSPEDCRALLVSRDYTRLLELHREFVRHRVEWYLRQFPAYKELRQDYLQDVYVYLLTKSLPNPATLEAVENGASFGFYLARTVQNILHSLLRREKQQRDRQMPMQVMRAHSHHEQDDAHAPDKQIWLADTHSWALPEAQDALATLAKRFEGFMKQVRKVMPKIAPKLWLMLQLQARIRPSQVDVQECFPNITPEDAAAFAALCSDDAYYRHCDDKDLYERICPFFQRYRHEKGSAFALQRWVNHYITGDDDTPGILDRLALRDHHQIARRMDKKMFADFLYHYFEQKSSTILKPVPSVTRDIVPAPIWAWAKTIAFKFIG